MLDRGENQWTIAAVATPAWAPRYFHSCRRRKAWPGCGMEFSGDAFECAGPGGSMAGTRSGARRYCRLLNESGVTQLHFHSGLGTDLTVPLAQGAVWCGGSDDTVEGVSFQANMPTEEVFTMPHRK